MKHATAIALTFLTVIVSPAFAQRERPDPFERYFTLPGIEFSKEQQAKVKEIRKDFETKLVENQKKWNSVITDEQVQARREAFQKARDAGKEGRELRDAVHAAIKITDEQRKQQAAIQQERNELLGQIRIKLIGLLTDEQRKSIRQPRRVQNRVPPTHADVKYGPHERNVMDVWLAESDKPTPVLVSTPALQKVSSFRGCWRGFGGSGL